MFGYELTVMERESSATRLVPSTPEIKPCDDRIHRSRARGNPSDHVCIGLALWQRKTNGKQTVPLASTAQLLS